MRLLKAFIQVALGDPIVQMQKALQIFRLQELALLRVLVVLPPPIHDLDFVLVKGHLQGGVVLVFSHPRLIFFHDERPLDIADPIQDPQYVYLV